MVANMRINNQFTYSKLGYPLVHESATKTAMAQGGGLRFGLLPVLPDGDGGILTVMCGGWQTSQKPWMVETLLKPYK